MKGDAEKGFDIIWSYADIPHTQCGYDYCRIAGLPELSLLEKIVISPYRLYTTILKLKPAAGSNSQAAQSCLTWHAILFEHDTVRAVLEAIPRHSFSDMSRDIAVAFLGSRE